MDGYIYHCEVYYVKNGVRSYWGEYTVNVTLHVQIVEEINT